MKNQQTTQSLHKWLLILYSQALNFHFPLFFFFHYISPVSIIRIKVGGKLFISIYFNLHCRCFPTDTCENKRSGVWTLAPGCWALNSFQYSSIFSNFRNILGPQRAHSATPSALQSPLNPTFTPAIYSLPFEGRGLTM